MSRKIVKLDPQTINVTKDLKDVKKEKFLNKNGQINNQFMLNNLLAKLDLKEPQKKQKSQIFNNKKQPQQNKYFLEKINLGQQKNILTYLDLAQQNIKNYQKSTRQQKFNKFRNDSQFNISKDKNRVHYKIIDIKKQNFINFNGKLFEYEDLQNQEAQIEEFYVLRKGKIQKEAYHNGVSLYLPQQVEYLIEQENVKNDLEQQIDKQSDDSNRQDRSDYDYPQEDYNSQNSGRSSQQLIEEKDYHQDNQYFQKQQDQQGQDQIYRKYLKRCQKKQQGDSEILYMYGLNRNKYDSSDDES